MPLPITAFLVLFIEKYVRLDCQNGDRMTEAKGQGLTNKGQRSTDR